MSEGFYELPMKPLQTDFLKCISCDEQITIRATSGEHSLVSLLHVLTWSADPAIRSWGKEISGVATPDTPVHVYEIIKDGNFKTIFSDLERYMDKLCLTQEQIAAFVIDHKKWLRIGGSATFFLFRVPDGFFVIYVSLGLLGRVGVNIYDFSDYIVWLAEYEHRFVLPQLDIKLQPSV